MRRSTLAAALVVGALVAGVAVPRADASSGPDVPGVDPTGEVVRVAPPAAGERGETSVRATPAGLELTWVSPEPLPFVDAMPEFRLDGRRIGQPTVAADGRTLSLVIDGEMPIDPAALEVWLGPRRLDQDGLPPETGPLDQPQDEPPTVALATDPGAEGTFSTTAFDYKADPLPWPEYDRPIEVWGHAVLPVGVTDAPLVVFLHGRHQPCFAAAVPVADPICPGDEAPVPSYLGYRYLQRMLATQGIASVSVSANVINADDYRSPDGGAAARSAVVRRHLELLADWEADPSKPEWFGLLDLDQVVLVGHSRGGEGVDSATIESDASAPWSILGQVLIAPVDFAWQTAGYTPTSVFLPSCDGDVFDLQGQRFVDAAQTLAADDPSLRSSVLMIGANHNYFNTEWTPGISRAPSFDDWFGPGSGGSCGTSSPRRLSASEQRRVARTYVAASVDAFLHGTQAAVDLLDSATVAIPPGVPDARVRTHAIGGQRTTVRPGAGATLSGSAEACASVVGEPVDVGGTTLPPCGSGRYPREVHWSSPYRGYESAIVAQLGAIAQFSLDWSAPNQVGGLTADAALDAGAPDATVDLRVVADPARPPARFAVRLGDGVSTWTAPEVTLQRYPGEALWAQPVRVDLADATIDTSAITTVELVSASPSGRVVVLDVSVRRAGLAAVPDRSVPVLRVGEVTVEEGDGPGDGIAQVPYTLSGDVSRPSAFGVMIDQSSFPGFDPPLLRRVDVAAGVSAGTIDVPYETDTRDERSVKAEVVVTGALEGLAMIDDSGRARIHDDDAAPTMRLRPVRSTVSAGQPLRFLLELSAPYDDVVFPRLRAVVAPGVLQVLTSHVPDGWLRYRIPQPTLVRPLSRALDQGRATFFVRPGRLRSSIAIPTIDRPLARTRTMTVRVPGAGGATVHLT